MGYAQVIPMPERSIGRSGRDLFLSHKDITIVMVPYELHSIFPKAVDELYRNTQIPFNLILVEGNAPEAVRVQLERRQRQHGNMTIIYTNHCPALANAYNLALPHIKTRYALFLDNEARLTKGSLESMMAAADEFHASVIYPQDSMMPRRIHTYRAEDQIVETVETFGLRPCFLISQDGLHGSGKLFDETSSPYTIGVDLAYKMRSRGLVMKEQKGAKIEMRLTGPVQAMDLPIFRVQWSRERYFQSMEQIEKKWGIHIENNAAYDSWLQGKMFQAERPVGLEVLFNHMASSMRDNSRRVHDAVLNFRAFGWAKESYPTKINAR